MKQESAAVRFSKPMAFFLMLRLNRTIMVAMIAGVGAFISDAGVARSLWMTLAGWLLAVGGFSLDFLADRDVDMVGPRAEIRHNPLSDGSLSPACGFVFSSLFMAASFVVVAVTSPRSLLLWGVILAVIVGLALHLFETPLARAFTLGLLQALYFLMGGSAGTPTPGLFLMAGMFFFAMMGGRGLTDIRDFPQDSQTRVETMPKRFGMKWTARFVALCLILSYALSLAAYFTGEFNRVYLYLDIAFVAAGLFFAFVVALRPSPKLAYAFTLVFMMGMGSLICLAMVLGKLG